MPPRSIGPPVGLALLFLSQIATAATIHVPADYPTIQQAINASTSGDLILVAPGTYHEHILWSGLQTGVKLHSESGAAVTIVDGGGTNFVLNAVNLGAGSEIVGFTFQNGSAGHGGGLLIENSSPLITDNVFHNNFAVKGGGIYLEGSPAQILRNEFSANAVPGSGGGTGAGLFCDFASPAHIEDNVFSGNQGGGVVSEADVVILNNRFLSNVNDDGGAVRVGGRSMLHGNEFRGNSTAAGGSGGAVFLWYGSEVVEDNTFVGNSSFGGGGAIYALNVGSIARNVFLDNQTTSGLGGAIDCDNLSGPTLDGNVIIRNRSNVHGGGVAISLNSSAVLTNNTFALNEGGAIYVISQSHASLQRNIVSHSQSGGGVVLGDPTSSITFGCDDVWGNTGGDYSGVVDPTGTNGNFSLDPLYCDLPALDVHLASTSPCAASNSPAGCGLVGALDVSCEGPVPTQPTTWGRFKASYR
jgi:predicted outer membrane repeat protein